MRIFIKSLTISLLTTSLLATATMAAGPASPPAGVTISGEMLRDASGRPLYTFDGDLKTRRSTCTDRCADAWPPLAADIDAVSVGKWTVIDRDDGANPPKQWAFKGKPLYTFKKDKPGDAGQGAAIKGWHLVKP